MKRFPIQDEVRHNGVETTRFPQLQIPLSVAKVAYAEYVRRHGNRQSLERLAIRGGFGRDEFLDLLSTANTETNHE